MACRRTSRLAHLKGELIDLIYPRRTGPDQQPPQIDDSSLPIDPELLDTIESLLVQRAGEVESRIEAVDRKLLSLFSLTSLLAVLSLGAVAGAAGLIPIADKTERWIAWLAIVLIGYILIQLIWAVNATVSGLQPGGYATRNKQTISPFDGESVSDYRRRQITDALYTTEQREWATNFKVSHMKVALKAIRNIIVPLVGLFLVAGTLAIVKLQPPESSC